MPQCDRLCVEIQAKAVRTSWPDWPRHRESKPQRAKTWRGWIASGIRKHRNEDWEHPDDPDARIAKMKDGTTHLAHKAEHAVDMETEAVLAVTLQPADDGDTTTIKETLIETAQQMERPTE